MGQQEYDNFKSLIREWLDSHPDEYAKFVEEMNGKNYEGFQKVLKLAIRLVPQYKKATRRRISDDTTSTFTNLENVLVKSNLAEKIVTEFNNSSKKNILPATLAWLYYGRCYECMVEQGKALMKRKDIFQVHKWLISFMLKVIIQKSIAIGARSKQDWVNFERQQKAIEENRIIEWSIEDEEDYPNGEDESIEEGESVPEETHKTIGRKADTRTLPELLIENQEILIGKIGTRLKTHTTETDIARLYIALVEYRFMRQCPMKTFRNALQKQFEELNIVHERGIQKAYKTLISPYGSSRKLMKDIGEDHTAIEELKAYLSV